VILGIFPSKNLTSRFLILFHSITLQLGNTNAEFSNTIFGQSAEYGFYYAVSICFSIDGTTNLFHFQWPALFLIHQHGSFDGIKLYTDDKNLVFLKSRAVFQFFPVSKLF